MKPGLTLEEYRKYLLKTDADLKKEYKRTNAGRDQLYVFITYWMTSWLFNHRKELLCLK